VVIKTPPSVIKLKEAVFLEEKRKLLLSADVEDDPT
jgi:hypothetical protein